MNEGTHHKVVMRAAVALFLAVAGWALAALWERRILRKVALYVRAQMNLRGAHGD